MLLKRCELCKAEVQIPSDGLERLGWNEINFPRRDHNTPITPVKIDICGTCTVKMVAAINPSLETKLSNSGAT